MKYLIIKIGNLETPILFPGTIRHDTMAEKFGCPVISAGFVEFGLARKSFNVSANCFGFSNSLRKDSRPKEDSQLITAFLNL